MPLCDLAGVAPGSRVVLVRERPVVRVGDGLLGRIVDGLGRPLDGRRAPEPQAEYPLYGERMNPLARRPIREPLDLGVRAMNALLTCGRGQRLGIFAGSGVGKSTLLGMMARYTNADVVVIGLVGERGREVQEFLASDLGAEGTARSIVVVSTSDEPPLMRRQAAYLTLATAEYFRDQGLQVLCLMDSVTRFAMALREIGLAAGEPPTTKGYTPSVFAELPRLLERAGPGVDGTGDITGVFAVLVDGDDHNEPIADAVRGILDGHLILDRAIAERGRYPAINILRSVSRTMPACNTEQEAALVRRVRQLLATYEDMADLIRIGAYRRGTDPKVDEAIAYFDRIDGFLMQRKDEHTNLTNSYELLARLVAAPAGGATGGAKDTPR
jgi:flagellum-specific ATP synthase